jgi:hypothetical protein
MYRAVHGLRQLSGRVPDERWQVLEPRDPSCPWKQFFEVAGSHSAVVATPQIHDDLLDELDERAPGGRILRLRLNEQWPPDEIVLRIETAVEVWERPLPVAAFSAAELEHPHI